MEILCYDIPACRFVVEYTIESVSICGVKSRVAEAIITELTAPVAANFVQLFVQNFVV